MAKIERERHIGKGKRDGDVVGNQIPSAVAHKQEQFCRCRGVKGASPVPGMTSPGSTEAAV